MKRVPGFLIRNKAFRQIFFAVLMLLLFIYFIKNEHIEAREIKSTLIKADSFYIFLGMVSTLIYILLQGLMYVYSFRAIHLKVSVFDSIILFLKRNFISVLLPAGGISSLAFFTKALEKKNLTKTQIYYASFIYAVVGMLTVIIISVPALVFSFKSKHADSSSFLYSLLMLTTIIMVVVVLSYFIIYKNFGSRIISKFWPGFLVTLENLRAQSFSFNHFLAVIGISLLIEVVGIFQIYISLAALGTPISLAVALAGYVLMTIFLILSPFLRGLGAIEVSLTLFLTLFGLSTIQATSGMLLFRLFEFWLPLGFGMLIFLLRPGKILLRVFPAALLFILGIVNILSAITPAIPQRVNILINYLPLRAVEVSNFFILVFGIILLINSYFMLRRLKPAWWLAFSISILSLIGHITKGMDFEEATLAAFAIVTLLLTYKEYIFRSVIIVSRNFFYTIILIVFSTIAFNVAGFYFIEKYHFNHEFTLHDSLIALMHTWFFSESDNLHTHTSFAEIFLVWLRVSELGIIALLAYGIFKPKFLNVWNNPDDKYKAMDLVGQYGNSSLDYYKTYEDKLLFFPENFSDGFIAYKVYRGAAVVLENPVCNPQKKMDIIREFDRFCSMMNYIYFIYRLPGEDIQMYRDLGMKALPIGQEAIVNLDTFTLEGRDMKSIRNGIRKVEKSGYTTKVYTPPISDGKLQQFKQVSDEWLAANNRKEMSFSQGFFRQPEIKKNTVIAIENREGKVAGFLSIIPDYKKGEGTYDLIRRTDDAPNGTMDYMLVNMFEYFKSGNLRYANLGMVPVTGEEFGTPSVIQAINILSRVIRKFSNFKGLREYKEKFKPEWETRYLAYRNDFDLILLPKTLSEIIKPD